MIIITIFTIDIHFYRNLIGTTVRRTAQFFLLPTLRRRNRKGHETPEYELI